MSKVVRILIPIIYFNIAGIIILHFRTLPVALAKKM